jgi:hypothetical protein
VEEGGDENVPSLRSAPPGSPPKPPAPPLLPKEELAFLEIFSVLGAFLKARAWKPLQKMQLFPAPKRGQEISDQQDSSEFLVHCVIEPLIRGHKGSFSPSARAKYAKS